jgi:IMP dehydrogenase
MYKAGGLAILHRYASKECVLGWIRELRKDKGYWPIPSIGVQEDDCEKAMEYVEEGAGAICVDVAHADSISAVKVVKALFSRWGYSGNVIAGNVATREGAMHLLDAGATIIKVGIGPGAVCTTRIVTGHGVPQLSAIVDVASLREFGYDFRIIADGGIRNSGDCCKAIAAGADAVMVGRLLAGCPEAPLKAGDGKRLYRGMASRCAQQEFKGRVGNNVPEGEEVEIPVGKSVAEVIEELSGGIRSGLSYSGAHNIKEFQEVAEFIEISQNTLLENGPHALYKG